MKVSVPLLLVAIGLAGCDGGTASSGPCFELCRELVQSCDYAAYPTFQSCEEGCAYNESRGADVPSELACVQDAACDTFAIIECENEHADDLDDAPSEPGDDDAA